MFKKIFTIKKLPAFSLLEIMAVVAIVAIALVGTTQLVVQSLRAQNINRSTIIAYQLAQEGVELVRHIRDTNWLNSEAWDEGMSAGVYCLDYKSAELRLAVTADNCQLYFDNNNWYYHPVFASSSDKKTAFTRTIEIIPIANTTEALKLRVSMIWIEAGAENSYILETELFAWR